MGDTGVWGLSVSTSDQPNEQVVEGDVGKWEGAVTSLLAASASDWSGERKTISLGGGVGAGGKGNTKVGAGGHTRS
jgi:hypothetical protein